MESDETSSTPHALQEPKTASEFIDRGWTLHVKGERDAAISDFRKAVSLEPDSVEAYYALGMALKMMGQKQEAIEAFEKTIELVDAGQMKEDRARAGMLRHLSRSHIDMIRKGEDLNPEP